MLKSRAYLESIPQRKEEREELRPVDRSTSPQSTRQIVPAIALLSAVSALLTRPIHRPGTARAPSSTYSLTTNLAVRRQNSTHQYRLSEPSKDPLLHIPISARGRPSSLRCVRAAICIPRNKANCHHPSCATEACGEAGHSDCDRVSCIAEGQTRASCPARCRRSNDALESTPLAYAHCSPHSSQCPPGEDSARESA